MTLFCYAIRIGSVSLLRFPFWCHVFLWAISSICRIYSLQICFSSLFCFSDFLVFLSGLNFLYLLPAAVISLSLFFLIRPSNLFINASSLLASLLPSFIDIYRLSLSSLGCKALCMAISYLVFWSIWLSFNFKNCLEYLTKGTAKLFIPLMRFLLQSLISRSFLVHLR